MATDDASKTRAAGPNHSGKQHASQSPQAVKTNQKDMGLTGFITQI
jgi:hypothetical protein